MASNITFLTSQPDFSPVYNKVEIMIKEQDTVSLANDNYKFVVEINFADFTTETLYVAPKYQLTAGVPDAAIIDLSRIIRKHIKENIDTYNDPKTFSIANDTMVLKYDVDVFPGWDVSGVFTKDPNTVGAVSVTNKWAWAGSFDHHDWIDQINEGTPFNTWICNATNGTSAKFLTNNPEIKARLTDLGRIYALTDDPANIDHLLVETYDSNGVNLNSFVLDSTLGTSPNTTRVQAIAAAPQSLNNVSGTFISTGAQPIIDSDVSYYTLQLDKTGAGGESSEIIRIDIENECRYEVYRIHFLNKLGGFDWFNFLDRNTLSSTITRKSYTSHQDVYDNNGINYNHEDNGKQDYYVKEQDKVKLQSDYLSREQMDWLKELVSSPLIFVEFTDLKGNNNYKRARVTSSNWEQKYLDVDKLFRLQLNIEFSHINTRQTR